MKSHIIITISLIFLVNCSSNNSTTPPLSQRLDSLNVPEHIRNLENLTIFDSDAKPLLSVRFQKEEQFGEIYPVLLPPTIGFGPETAVDQNGDVYIADQGRKTIHVYKPDGSLLTNIGREGKGPGEFMGISAIHIHHNRLIVYDSNLTRLQIFTLSPPELSKTIIMDSQQWKKIDEVRVPTPSTIFSLTDSTFLAGVLLNDRNDKSYYGYYTLNREGKIISDKIIEQQHLLVHQGSHDNGGTTYVRLPFTSKGIVDIARDGTIYHANTQEFLIRIYNSEGDFQRAFYSPYSKKPLEVEEALNLFHPNLHNTVKDADFPDFWPALESMSIDDENRIWISTIIADKDIYEWLVLDKNGTLLSRFHWPVNKPIEVVRAGYAYTRETDEITGIQQIVRYRIEMNKIAP